MMLALPHIREHVNIHTSPGVPDEKTDTVADDGEHHCQQQTECKQFKDIFHALKVPLNSLIAASSWGLSVSSIIFFSRIVFKISGYRRSANAMSSASKRLTASTGTSSINPLAPA